MDIDQVADRLDALADEVSGAASRIGLVQPSAAAFAGAAAGRLGELGRDLHASWSAALAGREREAAGHGARLTDLAEALGQAADGYRRVEDDAHRRHRAVG
jgi:hypothetical protein